jgi:hypothetical protein
VLYGVSYTVLYRLKLNVFSQEISRIYIVYISGCEHRNVITLVLAHILKLYVFQHYLIFKSPAEFSPMF